MFYFSSEVVDKKIEEFLSSFEEKIENLTEDAFNTQVIVLAWSFCLLALPSPHDTSLNSTVCWVLELCSVQLLNRVQLFATP